jgi:uncharacterized protein DUF1569
MTSDRRALSFERLDQVMPDVERLMQGYKTVGKWTLGQMCNHLGNTLRYSMEGFPGPKPPWLVRTLVAPMFFRKIMKTGEMGEGVKVPEVFLPKPGLDDRAEAEALRAAIALYLANDKPLADHPFFGPLTRDQWTRLHCIHCAHHLSFARPAT